MSNPIRQNPERQLMHKWFGGMTAEFIERSGDAELVLEMAQTAERRRGTVALSPHADSKPADTPDALTDKLPRLKPYMSNDRLKEFLEQFELEETWLPERECEERLRQALEELEATARDYHAKYPGADYAEFIGLIWGAKADRLDTLREENNASKS